MNEKGECVFETSGFELLIKVRPFFNFIRRKGFKSLFIAVDDIWLYNYHRREYNGITNTVFETISFV